MFRTHAQGLVSLIGKSPSPFHVVNNLLQWGIDNRFELVHEKDKWQLHHGERYMVVRNGTSIVFILPGAMPTWEAGFRVAATHSDSPGFRIKNSPEITNDGFVRLNAEVYGSPILSSWMDRPLGLAGRVVVKSGNCGKPEILTLTVDRPLLVIPSLAIHMNRDVNKGVEINPQKECLPVLSMSGPDGGRDALAMLIAAELSVARERILDYDLFVSDAMPPCLIGSAGDLISSPRLDNLSSVYASYTGLNETGRSDASVVVACFSSEEVGSMSWSGADSSFLESVLERIVISEGGGREEYHRAMAESFVLSADAAHGVHPAWPDRADPTNRPVLNRGIVIKVDSGGRYTSDGVSSAMVESLCRAGGIPVQRFYNRSDMKGGSTIGPVLASQASARGADVGIPILAMHSIRELCGAEDIGHLYSLMKEFYVM